MTDATVTALPTRLPEGWTPDDVLWFWQDRTLVCAEVAELVDALRMVVRGTPNATSLMAARVLCAAWRAEEVPPEQRDVVIALTQALADRA